MTDIGIKKTIIVLFIATFFALVIGCNDDDTVAGNIEESIKKEDQIITELQGKIDKRQSKLDKLDAERREKADNLAEEEAEKRAEAIRKYEEFLSKYPISEYTQNILISLGELYFERSEEEHIKALDDWEAAMEVGMAAEEESETFMFKPPPEPQPHYEKTIQAYQEITLKYKDNPYADVAYYGLGYCQQAIGEWEESMYTYYELTKNYPDSQFLAEAYFRIGEYYFEDYEFGKAVKYYALVPPDNLEFYDKALYKMGWAYYNMGDIGASSEEYRKSIEAFTTLIEVSEGKSVLTEEAMEFTAISLTEWSSTGEEDTSVIKALSNFEGMFSGNADRDYSADVLHQLGDVYLNRQDKLIAASTTYETVLRDYPNYDRAPEILDSLVECYMREENYPDAHQTRVRIVDNYGPTSAWYAGNEDPDVRNEGIKRWENNLYSVALYHYEIGLKEENNESINSAIDRYNQYLEAFPVNTKSYHVNFFLAESHYAVEDYENAGLEYQKTALGYTEVERYEILEWDKKFTREDSLYNSILSYNEIFLVQEDEVLKQREEYELKIDEVETLPAPDVGEGATTLYVEPLGPVDPIKEPMKESNFNLVRACNAFVDIYPQSKEVPLVLSRKGEVYFFLRDYDKAREAYNILVQNYQIPPEGLKAEQHDVLYVDACERIALTYWNEAEFYHKKAKEYKYANPTFAIESIDKAIAKYDLASVAYDKTLNEANTRQQLEVADRVRKLASYGLILKGDLLTMRADIDPNLAYVAVEVPEGEGTDPTLEIEPYDPEKAITLVDDPKLDLLVEPRDPISEGKKQALVDAAVVYEENADLNQGEEVGRLSLGKAAQTFDQAQDYDNAGRVYIKYAKTYPDAEDAPLAWKSATEMYELNEDYDTAAQTFMVINDNPRLRDVPFGEGENALPFGEIALFQAGVCYQVNEDWENSAEAYDRFNDEYEAHAIPRIKATFRQGKAYEAMGMDSAAIEPFKETVVLYKAASDMGLDVEPTMPVVAEAYFKLADEGFAEYDRLQLTMPQSVMDANLKKRIELSQTLIGRYTDCANLGQPYWTIACYNRIGDTYISFRDALFNAEVPPEIDPSIWEHLPQDDEMRLQYEEVYWNYKGALDEQGYALEESAIGAYTSGVGYGDESGVKNIYYDDCYQKMLTLRPTDVVQYDDVAAFGVKSDEKWVVSTEVVEGDLSWNKKTFDDSVWGTAVSSSWKAKDLEKTISTSPGDPSPIWDAGGSKELYLRRNVSATYEETTLKAYIQTRGGKYEFYIDGTLIGSSSNKDGWTAPDEYEVSEFLKPGDHVIAIHTFQGKGDSYGLMFACASDNIFNPPEDFGVGDSVSTTTTHQYQCPSCIYIYDEAVEGVEFFSESLDNWVCPDCGEDKWSFVQLEAGGGGEIAPTTQYNSYLCPTCDFVYDSAAEGIDIYETVDDWVCPGCGADKYSFVEAGLETPPEDEIVPDPDVTTPPEDEIVPDPDVTTPPEDEIVPDPDVTTPPEDEIVPDPDVTTPPGDTETSELGVDTYQYECPNCRFIYDDAVEGISFYSGPDDWVCPDCGTDKYSFNQISQ